MAELQHKIQRAIKLLQAIPTTDGPVEVCYSGGKDSDVILQLAKLAGINYRAIYKNTTIDPPGTIAHAKAMGAEIMRPEISFLELVKKKASQAVSADSAARYLKNIPSSPALLSEYAEANPENVQNATMNQKRVESTRTSKANHT